jgi:hypothetical protein
MNRIPFSIVAFAGACLLLPVSKAALAASVFVEGLPDAEVFVDGESMGRLPWDGPRELGEGPHLLRVSLLAHEDFEVELSASGEEDTAFVRAELLPLDRNLAGLSSLLLAGVGQHYEGRTMWGWGFMAAQLASATIALVAEDNFKSHRADFERAQLAYDNAIAEPTFREQSALMDAAWADMEDAQNVRNIALYSMAGIAVLSAVEAWWTVGRAVGPRVELTSFQGEQQLRVGLGGGF